MSSTISENNCKYIFNNFKTEKFKLTFEGWNRPVFHLFSFTRVSFCQNLLHFIPGQRSESWLRLCRVSFSVVFFLFLPHLRTLAQGKRSENCRRFGTGGPSLYLYPLLSPNILFFPTLTMAARAKKKIFWRSDLLTLSACTIGILSTLTSTEFDCAALLAML